MCNQSGFVGKSPNTFKLRFLHIFGRERGKDGCGVANGKSVTRGFEWGVNSISDAMHYYKETPPMKFKRNSVVIQHNRAKSHGAASKDNVHPFEIPVPNEKHSLIFQHNGTIKNTRELCEKHGVEWKATRTDSEHMGMIIAKDGFDVLKEYIGTASFMFYFTNEINKLYIWKGLSTTKFTTTSREEVERPLHFYYDEVDRGFYLASLAEHLHMLCGDKEKVKSVKPNVLTTVIADTLEITETEYDRSKVTDEYDDPYVTKSSYSGSYNDYYHGNNYNPPKRKKTTGTQTTISDVTTGDIVDTKEVGNAIYYQSGRYLTKGHFANGKFILDAKGYPDANGHTYYFKNGYLLEDEEAFNKTTLNIFEDTHSNSFPINAHGRIIDKSVKDKMYRGKTFIPLFGHFIYKTDEFAYLESFKPIDKSATKTSNAKKGSSKSDNDSNTELTDSDKIKIYNSVMTTTFTKVEDCENHFVNLLDEDIDWEIFEKDYHWSN